jgi:signal transduction histidine kinase/CheY-like chemotaxis protein
VRRAITLRYAVALSLIATTIVDGWVLLHDAIAASRSDAAAVSVAGAQTMLSQRVSALTKNLQVEPASMETRAELAATLRRMRTGHEWLTRGEAAHSRATPALRALYFGPETNLAARVEAFMTASNRLMAAPLSPATQSRMETAREAALGPLLVDLDHAVDLMEQAAAANIARAERTHGIIVIVALTLLALEALIIFRPLASQLGAAMCDIASALAEARRAQAARERFTAAVSHEMRTPLNGVIGMLDMVAAGPLDPEQARKIAISRDAAEHGVAILNDILDAASIEAGAFELAPRPVPLAPLMEGALAVFAGRAAEKDLALATAIDDVLPATVVADPQRLKQIMMNLVGNAVKFTRTGGVTLRAALSGAGRLRVEVTDTGPGMTRKQMGKLFGRFVQLEDAGNRTPGGTGLGLSISRDLVTAMGGEIGVESRVGVGSTFWFELPIDATDLMPRQVETPRQDRAKGDGAADTRVAVVADDPPGAPASLRMLVVDDNEVNRMVAGQMLARLGHEVYYAVDGIEAVDAVANRRFDIVLMDGEMPRMHGLEATRAIVTDWPENADAIIGLTAHAGAREHAACLEAGMVDVVVKPFRLEDLNAAITRAIMARDTPAPPASRPLATSAREPAE